MACSSSPRHVTVPARLEAVLQAHRRRRLEVARLAPGQLAEVAALGRLEVLHDGDGTFEHGGAAARGHQLAVLARTALALVVREMTPQLKSVAMPRMLSMTVAMSVDEFSSPFQRPRNGSMNSRSGECFSHAALTLPKSPSLSSLRPE